MTDGLREWARRAYESYRTSVGGESVMGDKLPVFAECPEHVQVGWMSQ